MKPQWKVILKRPNMKDILFFISDFMMITGEIRVAQIRKINSQEFAQYSLKIQFPYNSSGSYHKNNENTRMFFFLGSSFWKK